MVIKVDSKSQKLVQVTNENNGTVLGLYFLPVNVPFEKFEKEFTAAESQDEFDENNTIGAQRVFAYDAILDVEF